MAMPTWGTYNTWDPNRKMYINGSTGETFDINHNKLSGKMDLKTGILSGDMPPPITTPPPPTDQQQIDQQGVHQQDLLKKQLDDMRGLNQGAMQQQTQTNQMSAGDIQGLTDKLIAGTGQRYQQGQDALKNTLDQYRTNAMTDLTSGPGGEAFREKYNNLGLLNSGAFNTGLAQQFGDIQRNSDLQLMMQGQQGIGAQQNAALSGYGAQTGMDMSGFNALSGLGQMGYGGLMNTSNQGYGIQSDLGLGGLQRRFGQADWSKNADLQKQLAEIRSKNDSQNAMMGAGGSILGMGLGGLLSNAGLFA